MEPFWVSVRELTLRQGDYLPRCHVPVFHPDFGEEAQIHNVEVDEFDLVVVTQSCDLEHDKVRLVALCAINPIAEFEKVNPEFAHKGRWNDVLKGRIEGLHLLASPMNPDENS